MWCGVRSTQQKQGKLVKESKYRQTARFPSISSHKIIQIESGTCYLMLALNLDTELLINYEILKLDLFPQFSEQRETIAWIDNCLDQTFFEMHFRSPLLDDALK